MLKVTIDKTETTGYGVSFDDILLPSPKASSGNQSSDMPYKLFQQLKKQNINNIEASSVSGKIKIGSLAYKEVSSAKLSWAEVSGRAQILIEIGVESDYYKMQLQWTNITESIATTKGLMQDSKTNNLTQDVVLEFDQVESITFR